MGAPRSKNASYVLGLAIVSSATALGDDSTSSPCFGDVVRQTDEFGIRCEPKARSDLGPVRMHGPIADPESSSDLDIGMILADAQEHLDVSSRQQRETGYAVYDPSATPGGDGRFSRSRRRRSTDFPGRREISGQANHSCIGFDPESVTNLGSVGMHSARSDAQCLGDIKAGPILADVKQDLGFGGEKERGNRPSLVSRLPREKSEGQRRRGGSFRPTVAWSAVTSFCCLEGCRYAVRHGRTMTKIWRDENSICVRSVRCAKRPPVATMMVRGRRAIEMSKQ